MMLRRVTDLPPSVPLDPISQSTTTSTHHQTVCCHSIPFSGSSEDGTDLPSAYGH